jgi:glycosyltransferase involved in cell wall biosynthesis
MSPERFQPSPHSLARRVLIICYDYPSIAAAGVIRTYQLAKGLQDFGWQPIFLTAQPSSIDHEENIETSDGTLHCPQITVAKSRMRVSFRRNHQARRKPQETTASKSQGSLKRLVRFATQCAVPDGKIAWLLPAVKRGLEMADDYPIRLCLSVSPRPTAHLVAYRLARRLHVPWVADFALPWSDAHWLADRPHVIGWIDRQLEGLVVRSAQHISVAYADLARSLCARYGPAYEPKISVIATGFAEELFHQQSPCPSSKFTVVYPGNHFCEEGRDGEHFLKAIDEWIESDGRLAAKVEFVFMGKWDEVLRRQRAAMAYPQVVRIEPLASHRACIQTIMSAHMCLVNTVANRIPAKVYECMRSSKWILALTAPDSDLAALMGQYSRGIVVHPCDTAAIRQALQRTWQSSQLRSLQANEAASSLSEYSATHGAEMMVHIFDALTIAGPAKLCC